MKSKEIKQYQKQYRKEHIEEAKLYRKIYYKEHSEKIKNRNIKWRKDNPDKVKVRDAKYRKEHPDKVKIRNAKYNKTLRGKENNKRQRELKFNPLNEWFEGSEAHHINKDDIIYIPKNWHFKGHNVIRNKNMESINTVAFFFLMMQNINEFSKL